MTDRFTYDAGPYVLGALPPEDRRAFEEHLDGCSQCQAEVREFAGLPGQFGFDERRAHVLRQIESFEFGCEVIHSII